MKNYNFFIFFSIFWIFSFLEIFNFFPFLTFRVSEFSNFTFCFLAACTGNRVGKLMVKKIDLKRSAKSGSVLVGWINQDAVSITEITTNRKNRDFFLKKSSSGFLAREINDRKFCLFSNQKNKISILTQKYLNFAKIR